MTKLIVLYIQIAMQWNEMKSSRMFSRERWYAVGMGGSRKKQQISIVSF